jgi:hypothetical protein
LPVASSLENIELTRWQVMSGLLSTVTPSSEPIASSSTLGYGQAPQVSFYYHFFKTGLTHFLQVKAMSGLPIAVTPSSEPVASSSTFRYGQVPQVSFYPYFFKKALTHFLQANDVFTLPFLESQGTGLPALNDILSANEWRV